MQRIAIIVQGPIHPRTREALAFLNQSTHRKRLHIILVAWSSELPEVMDDLGSFADCVIRPTPLGEPGTCHRNWQAQGVHVGLQQVAGCTYVLKCRSDLLLSDTYLEKIVALADAGFDGLCVLNIYTRREPFHVSDFLVFGRKPWVAAYFQTSHYQDLFSPEVEFTRCYVRTRGLHYAHTLEDYLRFLRDEVEIIDFVQPHVVQAAQHARGTDSP